MMCCSWVGTERSCIFANDTGQHIESCVYPQLAHHDVTGDTVRVSGDFISDMRYPSSRLVDWRILSSLIYDSFDFVFSYYALPFLVTYTINLFISR